MPTAVRWAVSILSGFTAYFAYSILTLGLLRAAGTTTIEGTTAGLVGLGGSLVNLLATLAVNEWLVRRYRADDGTATRALEDRAAPREPTQPGSRET